MSRPVRTDIWCSSILLLLKLIWACFVPFSRSYHTLCRRCVSLGKTSTESDHTTMAHWRVPTGTDSAIKHQCIVQQIKLPDVEMVCKECCFHSCYVRPIFFFTTAIFRDHGSCCQPPLSTDPLNWIKLHIKISWGNCLRIVEFKH